MLEQPQLSRTSKHSPRICKGHQEIPKLIAAVTVVLKLSEYYEEKIQPHI